MTSINTIIVGSVISILQFILQVLDVPVQAFQSIQESSLSSSKNHKSSGPSKTVVIVGGNFAGISTLRELLAKKEDMNLKIIMIDQRDYSEYTPGILRLNKAQNFQRIQGKVTSLVDSNNNKILTYTPTSQHATSQTAQNIKYDYVVLATGATYTAPISPTPQELTLENRLKGWQAAHQCLVKAKTVIVLGGGAVGVELAAEIVDHYPDKQVTLLDGQWSLVPIFPKYAGDYALRWLEQRGVQVKLGQSLQSWTDTSCTLQDGTVLQADMVYVCFGSRPNSDVAQHQQLCALTNRQTVVVDETLQVQGVNHTCALSSIFACGDVASPPTHDEKQAFQAEIQGKVVARNVLKLLSNNYNNSKNVELYRYPEDIAGSSKMPLVFVLSLGRYDGVLGFNTLLVPGPLAAIAKWLLEYTKVLHMKGMLLGQLIWKLGDAVVLFLSRTLVLPASGSSSGGFELQKRLKAA